MQEPSKGDRINEGIMKQITSGVDPIQARAPYMPEIISFIPQFKLIVCSNEFMEIKSNDHGTWRRIRVVDFMSLFTENPQQGDSDKPYQFKLDRHITERFDEWAPVFAHMLVERAFQTNGVVADCPMVLKSSNLYRESQDYIAEFVRARIAKSARDCVHKTALSGVFTEWYRINYGDKKAPGPKDMYSHLDKQYGKNRNGVWTGIRIIHENDSASSAENSEDDVDEEDVDDNVNDL